MMKAHSEPTHVSVSNFRSPWVIAFILMAVIVVSVNILFIVASLVSNPGLVTNNYTKYGLQQYQMEERLREQSQRGWQVELRLPEQIQPYSEVPVSLHVRDRQGEAVDNARAEVTFFRPSDASQDLRFDFHSLHDQAGIYQTSIQLPVGGVWDMNILIERDAEQHVLHQRLVIYNNRKTTLARNWLNRIVEWVAPPSRINMVSKIQL